MPTYRNNSNYSRNEAYTRPMDVSSPQQDKGFRPTGQQDNLARLPLAMAYVPWQVWKKTYAIDEVLNTGTLFPELYKPFLGAGGYK